jgi:hypothetical protein
MMDPSRVRVSGPLERYALGFVAELVEAGYRPSSAGVQLRLLAHLSRWLEREGIDPGEVREPQLERFRREDLARVRSLRIAGGLVPLLAYLRGWVSSCRRSSRRARALTCCLSAIAGI